MNNNDNIVENGNSSPQFPQNGVLPQESLIYIAIRHRWIILSTVVLSLIVAFVYLLKATPVYTSASRLYVEQSGPKIISEYEGVMTRSKNYLYTQAELIKSTPIIADVVDDAQISRFRTFAGVDNLVGYVKKDLNVTIGKKDDIVTVSFNSPYPAEAAQIVNTVIDSYVGYHSTRKRSTVSQVLNILQREKVNRDKELSAKFARLLDFTRTNGIVSFDNKGGNVVFQKLSKLSEALTAAQLVTINAKADFEAAHSMLDEPAKIKQFAAAQPTAGVRVFINDMETQLLSELKDAEIELENARYYCTEEHPSIQAMHVKIEHIKRRIDDQAKKFADAYIEVVRLRWTTAKQREYELSTSFDVQQAEAKDLGIKSTEYMVLRSELKRTERLCEILDDRIKELNVTEDVGALNITVLEVARPSLYPSKPQRARIMTVALALGLIFGYIFALLRNCLDYRLRSLEEISAVIGVPTLGVVPTMSESQTIIRRSHKIVGELKPVLAKVYRMVYATVFSGVSKGKPKPIDVPSVVVSSGRSFSEDNGIVTRGQEVRIEPMSVVAEAYRTIRTAVFFGAPKDEAKTIVVTSPAPGDGKTTLVSNLAITMAQAGQKTIVLDADFRRPMQHKIFGIDNGKGLSGVLAGADSIDEAIQSGPVEGLDILSCGREVPNPSEMLNSDAFAEILKELSVRYDRVIIDSPPVTPVADSQILAAICDVTMLVLRAEKSTRRLSQQARDALISVGARILGVVVNDVSQSRSHYGYYYSSYGGYGGYGHYYGSGGRKKKQEQYQKQSIVAVETKKRNRSVTKSGVAE